MGSGRVGDGGGDGGEEVVEDRGDGGVPDRAGLEVLHTVFLGQRDRLSLRYCVFGGAVQIHLVANQHLDRGVGLLVDLDPLLYILEALPLGDIEHVDGSGAAQRVAEGVFGVADSAGDLPVVEAVDRLLLGKRNRLYRHLLGMLGVLRLPEGLADRWIAV